LIGVVGGAKQISASQVVFQNLRVSSGTMDLREPIEFQNVLVSCPFRGPNPAAFTSIVVSGDLTCEIVGRHQ
jgi:hypothetical protein